MNHYRLHTHVEARLGCQAATSGTLERSGKSQCGDKDVGALYRTEEAPRRGPKAH